LSQYKPQAAKFINTPIEGSFYEVKYRYSSFIARADYKFKVLVGVHFSLIIFKPFLKKRNYFGTRKNYCCGNGFSGKSILKVAEL